MDTPWTDVVAKQLYDLYDHNFSQWVQTIDLQETRLRVIGELATRAASGSQDAVRVLGEIAVTGFRKDSEAALRALGVLVPYDDTGDATVRRWFRPDTVPYSSPRSDDSAL